MQDFFSDAETVNANIHIIQETTKRISNIAQNVILAASDENEQEEKNELQPIIQATNKKAQVRSTDCAIK